LGKGVEAALCIKYGMLKVAGLVSTARRMTSGITGGPAVDPELMGALLGWKLPVASPTWNAKMQKLLALKGGVDTAEDTDCSGVQPKKNPSEAAGVFVIQFWRRLYHLPPKPRNSGVGRLVEPLVGP
jgi:hypothetical protein